MLTLLAFNFILMNTCLKITFQIKGAETQLMTSLCSELLKKSVFWEHREGKVMGHALIFLSLFSSLNSWICCNILFWKMVWSSREQCIPWLR